MHHRFPEPHPGPGTQRKTPGGIYRSRRTGQWPYGRIPWRRLSVYRLCRGGQNPLERRPRQERLGKCRRIYGLAESLRKSRQGTRCGFRGDSGPHPFCTVDDRRFHGRETADLVGSRGAVAGSSLRQEYQGRNTDGQPGPRGRRMASCVRTRQGRCGRADQGISHMDESPSLAPGRRPSDVYKSGSRKPRLERMDWCGAWSISAPGHLAIWPVIPPTESTRS